MLVPKTEVPQRQAKIETNFLSNTRNYPYREAVGSILYLAYKTRPDLSFAVGYISRYKEKPTEEKNKNIKQIFRYLNGSVDQRIKYFSETEENLIEFLIWIWISLVIQSLDRVLPAT